MGVTNGVRKAACLIGLVFMMSPDVKMLAQRPLRDLVGTVTDGREPLTGAIVEVHNEALGTTISYITDKTGHYSFKRLDGDRDYTVWATWRGHRSAIKKLSLFDSSPLKTIELEIKQE